MNSQSKLALFALTAALSATLVTMVSTTAHAASPDVALQAIPGCAWKDKGNRACNFKTGDHRFRIWKPNVISGGNGFRVNIKFDHILDNRKDDHLYTTIVNQGGRCSVQHQPVIGGQILGGIIPIRGTWRPTHEPGWEIALVNVANQVAFAYGCQ